MADPDKSGQLRRNRGAEARTRVEANQRRAREEIGVTRPRTTHWTERAACLGNDTETFFNDHQYGDAKKICKDCPVANQCLMAYLFEPFGVFGGMTPPERDNYRRNLRRRKR
jgi:transcription factor WhiB